jgi:hypothetical protein
MQGYGVTEDDILPTCIAYGRSTSVSGIPKGGDTFIAGEAISGKRLARDKLTEQTCTK